ncbi:MAG: hypothetical protein ABI113_14010 [Mucilaginibacter sp.]
MPEVIKTIPPKYVTVYKNANDSTFDCYIKAMIENGRLTGSAKTLAYNKGIMTFTVYPASNPLDMLTGEKHLDIIDSLIAEVVAEHDIPENKVVIGGMSVKGTGAVRYVQYCEAGKSKAGIKPAGVVCC